MLYDFLNFPVTYKTESGLPATDSKSFDKIKTYIEDEDSEVGKVINALIEINKVGKILNTFINAFENKAIAKADGRDYLHGNFNLGGTVSMRLSSSKVNLQQLPSTGTKYAEVIKECFVAPPGWIMCGADFTGLEAMIQALLTRDPQMLKIYEHGFDAHCVRALSFFPEKLPDLDHNDPVQVNSIAENFPKIRQDAKSPYFLLQYAGKYYGLMEQFGFSEQKAKEIEKNYHDLYQVSDEWVANKITEARQIGYVPLCFGGKLRTPVLAKTLLGKRSTPREAEAEARTAGNALGQSYGQLTNRAANEFMERVWNSKYALDIKIIAQIHDSIYLLIRNNAACVKWVNDNLIACMKWQDLEELKHDKVKLGANLELYYPNWSQSLKLKNEISEKEIVNAVKIFKEKV